MKIKRLLQNFPEIKIRGSRDLEITGVCSDSRLVVPGNLFVARKGSQYDGAKFVADAVAAGATAILTDLYNPSLRDVAQLIHEDVNRLEGDVAAFFHGHPSRELYVVGVTGTNGKTTTTFLIRHLLEKLGLPCGLIGSIENIVGPVHIQSTRTTPGVTLTHKLLGEMARGGCKAAVMEVTSHGLVQGRVRHVDFDVGVFTNLTQDHLDYHCAFEDYADAKSLLFRQVKQGVVNADDPWHRHMIRECTAPILTFGFSSAADIRAERVELSLTGSRFDVVHGEERCTFSLPLVGRFNISNCLAAIAVGRTSKVPLKRLADCFATAPAVAGRLQPVPNSRGLRAFVDYAHTPDALEKVLEGLREGGARHITTVFGCGGDRDALKRPLMGEVAERISDHIIITSDNPRSEDPQLICSQITSRLRPGPRWEICLDRREAIARAIEKARAEDVVLIAGKGHESVQILGQQTIPFDDYQVARELLA